MRVVMAMLGLLLVIVVVVPCSRRRFGAPSAPKPRLERLLPFGHSSATPAAALVRRTVGAEGCMVHSPRPASGQALPPFPVLVAGGASRSRPPWVGGVPLVLRGLC
jgi:hypothetical protein